MPNFNGETLLSLGNHKFILRPTFRSLMNIEKKIGKTIIQLCEDFAGQKFSLEEILTIITETLTSPKMSEKEIIEVIQQHGIINTIPQIFELLCAAIGIQLE